MDDFLERVSLASYQPHPDDRHQLLKLIEGLLAQERYLTKLGQFYGALVDAADAARDRQCLLKVVELADTVVQLCTDRDACFVLYSCSNAWACLLGFESDELDPWRLDHPALLKQTYYLRAAIQHAGFNEHSAERKAQIYCNLGNALSASGRWIEAFVQWRLALRQQPILGMARGNLGVGLGRYGGALYDSGHTYVVWVYAMRELSAAIEGGVGRDGATYQEAIDHFQAHHDFLQQQISDDLDDAMLHNHTLGKTKEERRYKQWCLDQGLFLNPLNDLGSIPIASADVFNLPGHNARSGITYLAFFNQLKQEYAFARYCLYQGSQARATHFADKDVSLSFNCDYAIYSIGLEQIKCTFRSAYSLLDKIAYFINSYWKLGIDERGVNFRTVWFDLQASKRGGSGKRQVREVFSSTRNLPLRGLYWLSQDIYSKELSDVASPEAKELDALRNHLEHKYVKVVDACHWVGSPSPFNADNLAHVIERDDLTAKAKLILTLSRSALIYLSLAMHHEESQSRNDSEGLIGSLPVDDYPDDLKV